MSLDGFLTQALVALLIVLGAIFGLVGSYGLLRLRDTLSRLHAPTKATTLGVGAILVASMLYFLLVERTFSIHEGLISLFLFLTAPITAHFLAKAYMHLHIPPHDSALPRPPKGHWSTFQAESEQTTRPRAPRPKTAKRPQRFTGPRP
jgi:multicomponent K+:H+ antiporter subunit G